MSEARTPPNVDPKHLDADGPPHPDRATEIKILRWALGYGPTERDPWTKTSPTPWAPAAPTSAASGDVQANCSTANIRIRTVTADLRPRG